MSILAEPPVAWVDKMVDKHGTRAVAQAYLEYLYTPEGQELAAKHYYRPRLEAVAQQHAGTFPTLSFFTIDEVFGGDLEMADYIQKIAGYCLTGDVSAECFFNLFGRGSNGKTKFLETLGRGTLRPRKQPVSAHHHERDANKSRECDD